MEIDYQKLTERTKEDLETGVKDRYGVIYSRDGKRLLRCVNDRLEKYKIRKGTEIICRDAFEEEYDGEHLMSIDIPDSVTAIGRGAFHGCAFLHQISIPDTVKYIGGWAFGKCESLYQLTLPASLKCIEGNPFCGCHYLNLKSNSALFSVKDDLLIDNDKHRLVAYLGHAESVNIPDSIISIDEAFWGCKSLKQVTIPNSVQTIGFRAFCGCESLRQIVIPDSVTTIEDYAFVCCSSLQQIDIPKSITIIGRDVFNRCQSLRQITIPDSVETIGEGAFSECESLEQIKIPASVTHIDEYAFCCESLKEINVDGANPYFTSVDNVLFSRDMSRIVKYAPGKTGSQYVIPNSVTEIADYAFYRSCELKSVVVPDGVFRIGEMSFSYCKQLESVTIPMSVRTIEKCAFDGCDNLKSIFIPKSVEKIGSGAFVYCWELKIKCEVESKPEGWNERWNMNKCPVVWGAKP